jgi:uncharacterized SAM-binding protein YcdF (DUF218 family)
MTTDTHKDADLYSVWVGGGEINSYYLTREAAERVAKAWRQWGYTDAAIRLEKEHKLTNEKGEDNK